MMRNVLACVALIAALAASGCAVDPAQGRFGEQAVRYGVVQEIVPVELEGDRQPGLGALVGAVAGGVLGHQVGNGGGRDVATVLGAIGGGLLGNEVQHRYVDRRSGQRIIVVLDDRAYISVTQPENSGLRVGDRVRIEGVGEQARITRD